MANKLETFFIFNAETGNKQVDLTRKNLLALNHELNNLGTNFAFSKTIGNDFALAEKSVNAFDLKSKTAFGNISGYAIGVSAAIGGIATAFSFAIDKTIEQQRANRLLASSATEAGKAFDVLAEKNRNVAKVFGLSDVAAASVTARIQQLATNAGNPAQFDTVYKRLADLSAAKGIDSNQLSDLVGTILSGQDEGLNRLGLGDPSKLQAAYAKEIGKTVDQLTQFEKIQAAVNAVVEKGAIFDGTAQARMASLEGQAAKTSAVFSNLTTDISSAATNNLFFQNSVDLITQSLGAMSFKIDEIKKKLREGFTPEQIAREEANSVGNQLLSGVSSFGNAFLGLPVLGYDFFTGNENTLENYTGGINPRTQREIFVRQRAAQISNQQRLDEAQEKDALEQQSKAQTRTLADSFNSRIDAFVKPASDGVEKSRRLLDDLNQIQKDFVESFNKLGNFSVIENASGIDLASQINNLVATKLGALDKAGIQEKIDIAARKFYTDDAKYEIGKFLENPNRADAKQNLEVLSSIKNYLSEDTFNELSNKLNKYLTEDFEKSEKKIKELEKTHNDLFSTLAKNIAPNNPFVAVFAETRAEAEKLKESIKGMPPELQAAAVKMQGVIDSSKLFSARIDNKFNVFDLEETAERFRKLEKPTLEIFESNFKNFVEKKAEEIKTVFNEIRNENGKLLGISQSQNNPFIQYNQISGKLGGFTQNDIRENVLTAFDRLANGSTLRRERDFRDLSDSEKRDLIEQFRLTSDDQLNVQGRLQKRLDEASLQFGSPEQQAIADAKALGFASGLNPNDVTAQQREQIAQLAEREAARRREYENAAISLYSSIASYSSATASNTAALLQVAGEKGLDGVNQAIEITVIGDRVKAVTGRAGTQEDVRRTYFEDSGLGLEFGNF